LAKGNQHKSCSYDKILVILTTGLFEEFKSLKTQNINLLAKELWIRGTLYPSAKCVIKVFFHLKEIKSIVFNPLLFVFPNS